MQEVGSISTDRKNRVPQTLGSASEGGAVCLPPRLVTWQQREPIFVGLLMLNDERPQMKPNGGYV